MAESSSSAAGPSQPAAPPKPGNPAFRMMGMPNFRFRLPSRNWMIFFTITGSFAGTLMYDRREKRRAQQKWCELVAHLAKEPLPVEQMRRKLTVYLAAPPGDGLRIARDHFKEYVKPVLVAAALDYTVVEGRREGDVRASTAKNIRKLRRKNGESSSVVEEVGAEQVVAETRKNIGIEDEPGPKGDLVIGRHTWKEYVRGLHEGWLGPLDPLPSPTAPEEVPTPDAYALEGADGTSADSEPPTTEQEKPDTEKEEKPSKAAGPTAAYISPADYSTASLPPTLPQSFDSSIPVPFPHILGFLNTPKRMYRYLTQRYLAEDVGREVAGIVLATSARPYHDDASNADSSWSDSASIDPTSSSDSNNQNSSTFTDLAPRTAEQQTTLEAAEKEWHKSVHKESSFEQSEREWLDDVVLDPRIASRMQRAVLSVDDEARSRRIASREEYILGEERPVPVPFWQRMWIKYGYGEDEETLRRKPIWGKIDGEDV
ncbi:uncharacterized protein PFLUO_LOCUS8928 [Penicillium psychrofluorescens]|uniref:uncharacterized protein n=1 Tax=Penicillium psychrofluorescens TaxID=3158075 RepID=UPI003CCDA79C